jgi:glycosyltransferase involved in cell wall biosynthesis
VRLSVIIPTRNGAQSPAVRCVESLWGQVTPADEVIVSVDGPDADPRLADLDGVVVVRGERAGPGEARNRALAVARAPVVLFLNDDVVAQQGLLDAHAAAHAVGGGAMVLGAAPWGVASDDRVIDLVLRSTSWIFFYDQMTDADPDCDWGFRHAWTLNLSVPRADCVPFEPRLAHPMLDDLEWAWRTRLPVRYRPGAAVLHEHRYTARALLRREALLGHQAACLHGINPACAREVFGARFRPEESVLRDARGAIPGMIADAAEGFRVFEDIAGAPARAFGTPAQAAGVFRASRGWRETARLIGSVHAAEGVGVERAMQDAEARIAGQAARMAIGGAA